MQASWVRERSGLMWPAEHSVLAGQVKRKERSLSSYGLADVVVFEFSGPMRCFWSSNLSQIETRVPLSSTRVV